MRYRRINFARYALGGAVVLVPAVLLERTNERWAWAYAILVLVMLVVFYWDALARAAAYTSSVLRGG